MAMGVKGMAQAGALLILLTLPVETKGEVFLYVDEEGVVHFSDVPYDARYQAYNLNNGSARPIRKTEKDFSPAIRDAARAHQVDEALVKAVIKTESDFNPSAVSPSGAQGLMQLMPDTALQLGVRDPFNPVENIAGGVRHLRHLLDVFEEDLLLTLAAYHAGEGLTRRTGTVPPIPATERYISKVLKFYKEYQVQRKASLFKVITQNGEAVYTNTPERYRLSQVFLVNPP